MRRNKIGITYERGYEVSKSNGKAISTFFGEDTFSLKVMQERLPKAVYKKTLTAIQEDLPLDLDTADAVANAMKDWAIEKGATHYAHWFQPMTGITAEKHDAFAEPDGPGRVIELFSAKQLVQGEPDASSFPSGGIRSTFEARGYTAWDMSSPAFIRRNGLGITLCIPSAFISYTGEALDKKTPLLKSDRAVNKSSMRMLKLLGNHTSKKVNSNCGPEQEYFLIDKDYYYKRQDLTLAGRAVIGAPPAKGQELEDQYFGSIKERIQSYMHDVEQVLYSLGIPAKTRHNEVAPSQFEIAPVYEAANLAADHNQLLMDTLKTVAKRHNLSLLLHEKPFAGINGSGKHLNWSISTDDGINLLNPGKTPHDNIQFLIFLTATIKAVFENADLLRASVASSGNDHRLGANEAPPAIISVFLGSQLLSILEDIEAGNISKATDKEIIDLGLSALPILSKDNTDRNRTSPFAFTGNKFEFRAVGSEQSIAFPATVLNTIVADAIDKLADKIEANKGSDINKVVIEVIRGELKEIKAVIFNGDGYSEAWHTEAEKRGLPNLRTTPEALEALISEKALSLFEKYGVLSRVELKSRFYIRNERYIRNIDIEVKCLINMTQTQILPAAIGYQSGLAKSIARVTSVLGSEPAAQKEMLKELSETISAVKSGLDKLSEIFKAAADIHDETKKAKFYSTDLLPAMNSVRSSIDSLEGMVDDEKWPLPKYWEMLFIS